MRSWNVYLVPHALDAGDNSTCIKPGLCFWSSDPFGERQRGHIPAPGREEDRCQGNRACGGKGCARGLLFYGGRSGRCSLGTERSLVNSWGLWGGGGCRRVGSPPRWSVDVLDEVNSVLMVKRLFHYGPRRCSADHFSDFVTYIVKYSCHTLGDQVLIHMFF